MFNMIVSFLRVLFSMFAGRMSDILIENVILKKENRILRRKNKKRIQGELLELDIPLDKKTIWNILS